MLRLTLEQAATLRSWFVPDRPGPLVGLHVLASGHGQVLVDRWPAPRVVLAEASGNYMVYGEPSPLAPVDLHKVHIVGVVAAPDAFRPLLQSAFPDLSVWPRLVLARRHAASAAPRAPAGSQIRRLDGGDVIHLERLDGDDVWIAKTWGGLAGLAASGYAWGAFVERRLVSIACSFFVGDRYEDLGVATTRTHRGRGLSVACAAGVCADIESRGRLPSWTTSPDNTASLRVAEKLGFGREREDRLFVINTSIPAPATPEPADAGYAPPGSPR